MIKSAMFSKERFLLGKENFQRLKDRISQYVGIRFWRIKKLSFPLKIVVKYIEKILSLNFEFNPFPKDNREMFSVFGKYFPKSLLQISQVIFISKRFSTAEIAVLEFY